MQFCASCGEQTQTNPCSACGVDPLLVGQYALRDLLGQGSHGMTWRADGPDGTVAVKVINLGHRLDPEAAKALDREVAVLSQLDHPQIPALIEHFSMRSGMTRYRCIVQAFVDGPNLLDELEAARHTPQQVMATIAEAAEILAYLHGLSPPIIHRDIKPQNLIRRRSDGALALIDFGSVRDTMIGTLGGTMSVGTVGYMPPEQITGDVRPESDVYALGALAVHLLTRQVPRLPHTPGAPLRWRRPAGLPASIGDLLDRMLSPDPANRPSSTTVARTARRLAEAPQHASVDEPTPPDPPEPPEPPSYRSHLPAAYTLLWLLGLAALFGAVIDVESIIATGPIAAIVGGGVAAMAWSRQQRLGALCAASVPVFCAAIFSWIALGNISPGEAQIPVPIMITGFLVVLGAGLIRANSALAAPEVVERKPLAATATPSAAERRKRRAAVKIER